jgi:signal transduction histidine kinase
VDVGELIHEVLALISAKAEKDRVRIHYQDGSLPKLFIDPELIKTCIFNSILNAFQAMPEEET